MINKDIYADLSALMDGQPTKLPKEQLIELLLNDEEVKAAWQRFHLIRYALKNKLNPNDRFLEGIHAEMNKKRVIAIENTDDDDEEDND